jgi:hypothetical protein
MYPVHILTTYFPKIHFNIIILPSTFMRGQFAKLVDSPLRVGTLWKCGDGLFFEVPPLESDALLTTLHPLLENVLQTVDHFQISCLGAPFS